MDRMKTFLKYAIWIVLFFFFSNLIITSSFIFIVVPLVNLLHFTVSTKKKSSSAFNSMSEKLFSYIIQFISCIFDFPCYHR